MLGHLREEVTALAARGKEAVIDLECPYCHGRVVAARQLSRAAGEGLTPRRLQQALHCMTWGWRPGLTGLGVRAQVYTAPDAGSGRVGFG